MPSYPLTPHHPPLQADVSRWGVSLLLGTSYLACMWLSEAFVPHPATLFPASALALAALFLVGIELWPIVYLATLAGCILIGYSPWVIILIPIAQTLQAVIGAYLMRLARIDPLFRRSRDSFWVIGIILAISLIVPVFGLLAALLRTDLVSITDSLHTASLQYVGTVFCLVILTPFLLRWFAKPHFSRTWTETLELVAVFALLLGIDFVVFLQDISTVGGIPTIYFVLIPLFWIALRLRPRFVTLALVITSAMAIASLYETATTADPALFDTRLFQTEEFLIALATTFLIMVSLEENRRLNANLIRSQVATLENAIARVSLESQAKNNFIAVLSHELRNPLTPIVSGIDFFKLKNNRDKDELDMLAIMEERMQAIRRLLDDLLDIARIAEGKISLKKDAVDLETVMKKAILSTDNRFKERHQALIFKAPHESISLQGDAMRMEQVFSNLLTNASKYSDSGGTVTVTIQKRLGQAEIVVSDTGVGIEAEAVEKIFTPFYQVNEGARNQKGLGIGLALVRSFVEMHNGTVAASSRGVGLGSDFSIFLPLTNEKIAPPVQDARPHIAPASKTRIAANSKHSQSPHVLIVDDMDIAAWSIGKLLEMKGCSVIYAYNGKQAIEAALKGAPDVVILDIGLPDIDGYTVAKTLRERGFRGKLIALTGYGTPDARKRGAEAGFEEYLVKPATIVDLMQAISKTT